MTIKRPSPNIDFEAGPFFQSCLDFQTWLQQTPHSLLRIPIFIELSGISFAPVKTIFLGCHPSDKIKILLNDCQMGSSFASQLSHYIYEDQTHCSLWIEGHWGTDLPMFSFSAEENENIFTVRSIVEPIEDPNSTHFQAYIPKFKSL